MINKTTTVPSQEQHTLENDLKFLKKRKGLRWTCAMTCLKVKVFVRSLVPDGLVRWVRVKQQGPDYMPPLDKIAFGDLRRLKPFCDEFGYKRGGPIDRYYIEEFLAKNAHHIKGHVLELKDPVYTQRYGGVKVTKSDVLDIDGTNPHATIVTDLAKADCVPSNTYDCIILTQVLQLIYDLKSVMYHLHRILKPGGVLLITVPGISHFVYKELGSIWCWCFTEVSVRKLLLEEFQEKHISTQKHGNVLTSAGFLYGIGINELRKEEYDFTDPDYQTIIEAKAFKPLRPTQIK